MSISSADIDRLRRLGLLEATESGAEAVRLTAQFPAPDAGIDRAAWRDALRAREAELRQRLAGLEATVVADSLSVVAQTVELVTPIREIAAVEHLLSQVPCRIDLVAEQQITSEHPPEPR